MHAHRCEKCNSSGIQTIWIHGDECAGQIAAHKCPKCGEIQWKKWLVPVGSLPAQKKDNDISLMFHFQDIFQILAIILVALACISYILAIANELKGESAKESKK
jgi:hypothetical protein